MAEKVFVKLYRLAARWRSGDISIEVIDAKETAKLYRMKCGNGRYASYTQIEKAHADAKGYYLTPEALIAATERHASEEILRMETRLRDAQDWQRRVQEFAASDWRSALEEQREG